MSYGEFLHSFFSEVWRIFQLNIPVIDISFGSLFIGLFIVNIGFWVLHLYFGLSSSSDSGGTSLRERGRKRYERRSE